MATVDLVARLVLENGMRWGEVAADWQRDDVTAILDRTGPRRHFLTRPRGGSKTSDLGAVLIAALIDQAPAASRSYAFAVDRGSGRTARRCHRRVPGPNTGDTWCPPSRRLEADQPNHRCDL